MATQIGRTLTELDNQIKQLNQSAKEAQGEASKLDKAMQMNPGSVDAVRQKYANLASQLQIAQQKMQLLKQKQNELTQEFNQGQISEQTYNKQLASISSQTQKTEQQIQQLTTALEGQNSAMRNAQLTAYGQQLDKLTQKTKTLSKATTGLVAALAAVCTYATKTGDELYDTAKKYDTTVESLQIWENRLEQAASDSDAYVDALSSIGTIQSSIAKNGGARYASLLEQLGITTEELNSVSKSEAFDMIFEGLQNIEDESQRATIAQGLLGDSGLDIATIAGLETEEINALDEALEEAGIISTEQAATADELASKWELLKQEFSGVALELLNNLMPVINTLVDLIETYVIPAIEKLTDWFGNLSEGQQQALLIILMLIIFLPKMTKALSSLTTGIKTTTTATYGQASAAGTLSAASTPLIPIFIAIAMALMIVITLMSLFSKSAKETAESCNDLVDALSGVTSGMQDAEASVDASSSVYTDTSGTTTWDINIEVEATGDTEVSQENADELAEALADRLLMERVNEDLGRVIK